MFKRIVSALLALLLCAGMALAETPEGENPAPEYEEVIVIEGTPAIDAGVNVRQKPDAGSAKLGQIPPGGKCTVTGKSNGWYSVVYNGKVGYVRQDLLALSQRTELVEKIVEDPLAASCEGFSVPFMQKPGTTFPVAGKVTSNIPIVEVVLRVYDLRALKDEALLSSKFTREQDVREFDLSAFSNAGALTGLSSGEKKFYVEVHSANEAQEVASARVYMSGKCADAASITSLCEISVTRGRKQDMLDDTYATSWRPASVNDVVKIVLPKDRVPGGLLMEWDKAPKHVQITYYDAAGEKIDTIYETNPSDLWNLFYELDENVLTIEIRSKDSGNAINKLRVYEKGRISEVVQRWEQTPEKIDLMLIVAHMNDETLYFSGTLAKLSAQGYKVLVVYMTGDDRNKHAEALDCIWTAGCHIHPVFIGFMDYKVDSYSKAEWLWGSENTYRAQVEQIRKYRPDVVLTHDWNGEYGHNQHIMTARYTVKSVQMAGSEEIFPDLVEQYGVWDTPKLYLHLHDGSKRLDLHFNDVMTELDGRSPMEMAFISFDKHYSQIKRYSLHGDGVTYDCTWFSLYRSNVGEDVARNSFFEHVD